MVEAAIPHSLQGNEMSLSRQQQRRAKRLPSHALLGIFIASLFTIVIVAKAVPTVEGRGQEQCRYRVQFIADLDKQSALVTLDDKGKTTKTVWRSRFLSGTLSYYTEYRRGGGTIREVEESQRLPIRKLTQLKLEIDTDEELQTGYNIYQRGGELSDLVHFADKLLAPDDKTGIVYQLLRTNNQDVIMSPWSIIGAGAGNQTNGLKNEWMTVKGDKVYVGSHGVVKKRGNLEEQWIAIVDRKGGLVHQNWTDNYNKIRSTVGVPDNGYVTHEAVLWSDLQKRWLFLPRKVSFQPYSKEVDFNASYNKMISCSETFDECKIIMTIGTSFDPTRSFSAFKYLPNTNETIILALKTVEDEKLDTSSSYCIIFDNTGKILLPDVKISDYKLEGLELFTTST